MPRVIRSPLAEDDLLEIWLTIAADNPAAADRMLDRISDVCTKLGRTPRLGVQRPELGDGIRSFPVGQYVIFYRLNTRDLQIVRVLSGYRDISKLL